MDIDPAWLRPFLALDRTPDTLHSIFMIIDEPLPIEVTRGNRVESVHAVDVCVSDALGNQIIRRGDAAREIYTRSSAKPLQALPLIESGAAAAFSLTDEHIALACASHSGEPEHTQPVSAWLAAVGCGEDTLECGAHRPKDEVTADRMVAAREPWSRLHNNCSGKHAGFISTARYLGEDPSGYLKEQHAVQQRVTQALSEMCDVDLSTTGRGEDGCGIPVIGMPLDAFARGMARMADPRALASSRAAACGRIVASMARHPYLVAGRGRLDTELMGALNGVATKTGAEGVHIAIIPSRKIGIAVKARCGTQRAAESGMIWALQQLDIIGETAAADLSAWVDRPVRNTLDHRVGTIRAGA